MAEDLTPVKKKEQRLKELELDRDVFLQEAKDITDYILPYKGLYVSEGEKPHDKSDRFSKIISPIASEDNDLLASGIQGGLSSQSRPWFRIQPEDKSLLRIESVAMWCNYVEERMYSALSKSNFYTKIHDFYGDESAFGNAVIICEPDFNKIVRFRVITPGMYCFAEGVTGEIDTLYLRYPMRAINVRRAWPNTCSDTVKQNAKKKPFSWVEIVHAVEPNNGRDVNKVDNRNFPYSSCYYEHGKPEKFLGQSGYFERPFAVGRWRTNDVEAYGTGPGHTALGLVKMLQSMEKTSLKAIHKSGDPPLRVSTSFKDSLNTLPGGINFLPPQEGKEAISKLFELNFDYPGVEGKISRIEAIIHTIFKRDLFLLITDRPEMTATEVIERSQEKLIMLGPVTERQVTEVLEPLLDRVFNIMGRFGMIPPPPLELQQQPRLKIDYISLLAQAQKMVGLQGMRSYADMAARVAEISTIPSPTTAKTNFNFMLDEYASSLSLPPQITRSEEQVAEIIQLQQQNQRLMEQVELLKGASEVAANLSKAKTDEPNALTAITGQAE